MGQGTRQLFTEPFGLLYIRSVLPKPTQILKYSFHDSLVGDVMVVKLKIKVDWHLKKEQPVTIYFYRDRIEADTVTPFDVDGEWDLVEHHRTLAFDDWFLMNDTMRKIMKRG